MIAIIKKNNAQSGQKQCGNGILWANAKLGKFLKEKC